MTKLKELDISYCGSFGFLPECLRNIELLDVLIIDSNMSLPFQASAFHNPSLKIIVK
jgi:hypothetical protein